MVGFEIFVRVELEKRQEFLHTFKLLTRPEKRDVECLTQNIFEDAIESNRFLWIENWTDLNTLENHLKTERFRSLMGAIDVLGELEDLRMVQFKPIRQEDPVDPTG